MTTTLRDVIVNVRVSPKARPVYVFCWGILGTVPTATLPQQDEAHLDKDSDFDR